ncbi:MAG: TrkH family potassium uptake protein, partial [Ruminococcaceae bacterium]|nr:TrkH family potassium uptake protein [Oscillospiraceae bacterium]
LAILPSSGGQAMHLLRAETPGPTKGKLVPKMRQSAIILYGIYVVMTIILVVALLLCKLPLYDSLVTAFGTAGTGGFSVLNASIGGYNNPAAEWVIAVFMVLFGINFNLYYFMLIGKARDAFKSEELRVYLAIVALATIAITVNTVNTVSGLSDGIRTSFFQVASIISTSGFATVDYNLWSSFAKSVLLLLMITGACAGSTAGGLKISRVIILLKSIVREIKHMLNPRSVNVIRLDGKVIEDETTRSALGYLAVYITLIITSVLLLSFDGFGLETNLSATLACINNVGPGFDAVGPASNFADYSLFSKAILSVAMLIGRLEIMPMMILFTPFAWKKR